MSKGGKNARATDLSRLVVRRRHAVALLVAHDLLRVRVDLDDDVADDRPAERRLAADGARAEVGEAGVVVEEERRRLGRGSIRE